MIFNFEFYEYIYIVYIYLAYQESMHVSFYFSDIKFSYFQTYKFGTDKLINLVFYEYKSFVTLGLVKFVNIAIL